MSDGAPPFTIEKIPENLHPVLNLYLEESRRRIEAGSRAGDAFCARALRDFEKTMETQHMRLYLAAGNDPHFNGFADAYFRDQRVFGDKDTHLVGYMYNEGWNMWKQVSKQLKKQAFQA
jgi:hypothetical protein